MDLIQAYPAPGDNPNARWRSTKNAKLRFMPMEQAEKIALFVDFVTEHVLAPLIEQDDANGETELLHVLELPYNQLDADSQKMETDACEEVFEQLQSRINGVAALAPPVWHSRQQAI